MTYAFPDPLVAAYRHSVVHVILISVLDGTAPNWFRQEHLSARMSETFPREDKGPRANSAQVQRSTAMQDGGKREGPIEVFPKFWNLNPIAKDTREILRIPAWTKCFEFTKREPETILELDKLPAAITEFPTVRRMTLGMNSPMVVPQYTREQRWSSSKRSSWKAGTPCSSGIRQRCTSIPVKPR